MSKVDGTYGDDVLDHGVGGGQAGPQQVRHYIYDLLVQLREPDNQQGITKRCRLFWLTNRAPNEYSCVHYVTWSPNKLWKSNTIFNLC
jgi:hypothetical protein